MDASKSSSFRYSCPSTDETAVSTDGFAKVSVVRGGRQDEENER